MSHAEVTPAMPPELGGGPAEELAYRLVQQKVLADFGLVALRSTSFDELLQTATELCAQGLATRFCKALEHLPDQDRFLVRAGVGWDPGVVGVATIGADLESPAGFALKTGRPVISNHLAEETRFRTPKLLEDYGVKRAINVLIAAGSTAAPFGVLEVDSSSEGRFEEADLAFMQGFANLLGVAIERYRAETLRTASEERLRAILENAPEKIWVNEADGSVTYFNAKWRDYTGQPATPDGLAWLDAVHPEDREPVIEVRTQGIATGQAYDVELRLRDRADGSYRWHRGRVTPLKRGEAVYAWIGTATDIDDIRQAELRLRESEVQFRTLADTIPQLAWMARPDGCIYWYNQRWYEYTGTTLADMQGSGWRAVHHPDHVDRVVERIQHSWDTGEPWEDMFPLRGKDGGYRWFLSRALPIRDADGCIVRWFGTNTDITEWREAEERQQLLMHELTHRVKNTLATVQAIARQSLRNAPSLAAFGETFDARLAAIASAHNILTAGQWQTAELNRIVADELAPYASADPTRVRIEGPPVELPASTALMAALAFHELTTNAAKYGALSVPTGRITVSWRLDPTSEGGRLHLSWVESGGPAVQVPKQRGFGSRLIERSLGRELGGEVRLDFHPEGLRCTMTLVLPPAA